MKKYSILVSDIQICTKLRELKKNYYFFFFCTEFCTFQRNKSEVSLMVEV